MLISINQLQVPTSAGRGRPMSAETATIAQKIERIPVGQMEVLPDGATFEERETEDGTVFTPTDSPWSVKKANRMAGRIRSFLAKSHGSIGAFGSVGVTVLRPDSKDEAGAAIVRVTRLESSD